MWIYSPTLYVKKLTGYFPASLKSLDVTPLHKKGKKDLKENYRPGSIGHICQLFPRIFNDATMRLPRKL